MLISLLDSYFAIPADPVPEAVRAVLASIADFRHVLCRESRQIIFFGTFKSGKSTLINALIGAPLLPTRVLRATGVITKIDYAAEPSAQIVYRRPQGTLQTSPISFDDAPSCILLDLSDTSAPVCPWNQSQIEEVQLGVPFPLLHARCTLVDTHLMDDLTLTQRSYREVARSDLAILVVSAYQLLSMKEREAAQLVQTMLNGNVAIVINQMDVIAADERAEVMERAWLIVHGIGNALVGQPRIFALAAEPALDAKMHGRHESSALDELAALEHWLGDLLRNPAWEQAVLLSRLARLERYLITAYEQLRVGSIETSHRVERMHREEMEAHAREQAKVSRAIAEDWVRLGKLKRRVDELAEEIVTRCHREVECLMESDTAWGNKLPACFDQEVQAFITHIERGAAAALAQTKLTLPPFDPERSFIFASTRADTRKWLGEVGFLAGLVPGSAIAPVESLIDSLLGDTVGTWVKHNIDEVRHQALTFIEQGVRDVLPSLKDETERYLAHIETMLTEFGTSVGRATTASDALHTAEQDEQSYRILLLWCQEFQQALARAKKSLEQS